MPEVELLTAQIPSPMGPLMLVFDGAGVLRALDFDDHEPRTLRLMRLQYGSTSLRPQVAPEPIVRALEAYFAGQLEAVDALQVETAGTPFQRRVWAALRTIPAGQTRSYGALAAEIGHPTAFRAVGLANGANPIGIVLPCHRVIGADGALTGYGGGLPRKRWLLEHEQRHSTRQGALFSTSVT
jgi:methylated-DNA-[protein]-cysteine S-methyltransferase